MSAIAFCFFLLIAGSQVGFEITLTINHLERVKNDYPSYRESLSVNLATRDISSEGAWTDNSLEHKNNDLQELDSVILNVVASIDSALSKLENGIEGFKALTWTSIDTFKAQADQAVNTVQGFVEYSADRLEFELSRLLHHNVSELTCDLVGRFREQANLVFDSTRDCIEGPINKTIGSARRISDTGTEIRYALQDRRKEVLNCKIRAKSFSEGLQCVTKISDNVNKLAFKIPTYLLSLIDLALDVTNYPANLQFCIAQTPLIVIRKHYMGILIKFPECLSNKLVVTASNVWEKLSSAYHTVKGKYTRNPLDSSFDLPNQILFPSVESNPPNMYFFSEFLKNQQYPNLEILNL